MQKKIRMLTICLSFIFLGFSHNAFAQDTRIPTKHEVVKETTIVVTLSKKQFSKINKNFRNAGYKKMGTLAAADPNKLAVLILDVGFTLQAKKTIASKVKDKTSMRIALSLSKTLIAKAAKLSAKIPLTKAMKTFFSKNKSSDDDPLIDDYEWIISYSSTSDITT